MLLSALESDCKTGLNVKESNNMLRYKVKVEMNKLNNQ